MFRAMLVAINQGALNMCKLLTEKYDISIHKIMQGNSQNDNTMQNTLVYNTYGVATATVFLGVTSLQLPNM